MNNKQGQPSVWAALFPMLFVVAINALHPVPGGLLTLLAVWRLGARSAPGIPVTDPRWWKAMAWPVVGALVLILLGGVVHAQWVRPAYFRWAAG
jgi:hypothetical protein